MRSEQKTYVVISIATNIYFDYWTQMANSLIQHTQNKSSLKIVLLTDQIDAAKEFTRDQNRHVTFEFIEIPNYKWPEATLLRYELLSREVRKISGDYFIYIDSDMIIRRDLISELQHLNINSEMYFAAHPGYALKSPGLNNSLPHYILKLFLRALYLKYRGAWETDPASIAYVPIQKRKRYLHGAFWFARKETFVSFADECAENTRVDSRNNLMASWHDESHLNAYFVKHGGNILSTRFSWHPKYEKFLEKEPIVESVDNLGKTR